MSSDNSKRRWGGVDAPKPSHRTTNGFQQFHRADLTTPDAGQNVVDRSLRSSIRLSRPVARTPGKLSLIHI